MAENCVGGEPPRMEIELSVPGMDPEVNEAMRERIADGLRRMEKIHDRIEEFVEQATSAQPDGQTKNSISSRSSGCGCSTRRGWRCWTSPRTHSLRGSGRSCQ